MWDRPSSTSQRQQEYATGTFVTSHPASQSYRDERGNSPSGSQWLVSKTVCKPRQTALLCSSYTQLTSKLLFLTQTTAARLYNQSWDWSTQQQHHMTIPGCPKHSVHAQPAAKRKMELCCETHWFLSVPLQASISIKGYSAKDDSYTRYYLSSLFQEFCPFFQGFPAKNQYNIPNVQLCIPSCRSAHPVWFCFAATLTGSSAVSCLWPLSPIPLFSSCHPYLGLGLSLGFSLWLYQTKLSSVLMLVIFYPFLL